VGRALSGSATIRSRLVDHYSGFDGPCTQHATHYAWEITAQPAEREARRASSALGKL
jgi:hypothetical protein